MKIEFLTDRDLEPNDDLSAIDAHKVKVANEWVEAYAADLKMAREMFFVVKDTSGPKPVHGILLEFELDDGLDDDAATVEWNVTRAAMAAPGATAFYVRPGEGDTWNDRAVYRAFWPTVATPIPQIERVAREWLATLYFTPQPRKANKTLAEFRATGRRVGLIEGSELVGMHWSDWAGSGVTNLIVYDKTAWIEELPNEYRVHICQFDWAGTRAEMEARLFFDHYVDECSGSWTLAELAALLDEWIEWRQGLVDEDSPSRWVWLEGFARMLTDAAVGA